MKYQKLLIAFLLFSALAMSATGCKKSGLKNSFLVFLLGRSVTAPEVLSTMPANRAMGVSITPVISARFSMDMDSSTLTAGTFTLAGGKEGAITGTITYDAATRTATLALSSPAQLEYLTQYTVTISDKVRAILGRTLAGDEEWSFTTVAEGTVPAPSLSPLPGTQDSAVNVVITCTDSAASIRYTIDGTEPTSTYGTPYITGVAITQNRQLRAVSYRAGWSTSSITDGQYNIRTALPAFDPPAGTQANDVDVKITSYGDAIYYEMTAGTVSSPPADPADPTTSSDLYSSEIAVTGHNSVVKIKAISVKSGMTESLIRSGTFTIDYSLTEAKWGEAVWGVHKWNP